MIYLYAITEPAAHVPTAEGLADQPLRLVSTPDVGAVCSEHDPGEFEPTPDALWRHDQIVEAAMAQGPVLPARFGTTFIDADALRTTLERDRVRLRRQLERLRGCVELAVRVSPPTSDAASPSTGQEYIHARLDDRRARRALAEQTLAPLASHAVRSRTPGPVPDTRTLTASFLVRAAEVDEFADRVRVLAERHSELVFSCTGPWPPYSFAEEEEEEEAWEA
jgi:Gas vesicle synthesis protein GvpL/GvpF